MESRDRRDFDVTDWTSYVGERVEGASPEGGVNTYPRRFIFLLNRQGAAFEYLARAKRDLRAFIVESMAEGDEAMVIDVGYSLKVVQDFRAGKADTLEAVRKLSQMQIDYPMGADRAAQQIYRDFESLVQALVGIPGRKVVILFSNELPTFAPPGAVTDKPSGEAVESLNQANTGLHARHPRTGVLVHLVPGRSFAARDRDRGAVLPQQPVLRSAAAANRSREPALLPP
jgi:hypothetical protein